MKVVVMGQGYVGLPLALAAAEAGHEAIGFEPDHARRRLLSRGRSCVEDVTDDRVQKHLGVYCPAVSPMALKRFDVGIITVPTPVKDRLLDANYVREAAEMLGAHLTEGALVVLESTSHPGTTRDIVIPALEETSGFTAGDDFHVAFSDERIKPARRTKTIGGYTMMCRQVAAHFYQSITEPLELASTLEAAELTSMASPTGEKV